MYFQAQPKSTTPVSCIQDTRQVAILTIPRYLNYGTQLQAFALAHVIRCLGYSVEVIDYGPKVNAALPLLKRVVRVMNEPMLINAGIKRRIQERRVSKVSTVRLKNIYNFSREVLPLGKQGYNSYSEILASPPEADAFVVGSDQIWNPAGNFGDDTFYLKFVHQDKRIAYGPSIGLSEIPGYARTWMKKNIEGIPYLSVREQRGAELIKELTGRSAEVVTDPTMLLTRAQWDEFLPPGNEKLPYMLCYILEGDKYIRERAEAISKHRGFKLLTIPIANCDILQPVNRECWRFDIGPFDFLRLIRDASFVCTDSFHGTIFASLFQVPFLVFQRYENAIQAANFSRMMGFLRRVGLEDSAVDKHYNGLGKVDMDFAYSINLLEKWRKQSIQFLETSLFSVTGGPQVS